MRVIWGGPLFFELYLGEEYDFFEPKSLILYDKFLILKLMSVPFLDVRTMWFTKDTNQYSNMASVKLLFLCFSSLI